MKIALYEKESNMKSPGLYVAQKWHEVLMNSLNEDDVKKLRD